MIDDDCPMIDSRSHFEFRGCATALYAITDVCLLPVFLYVDGDLLSAWVGRRYKSGSAAN